MHKMTWKYRLALFVFVMLLIYPVDMYARDIGKISFRGNTLLPDSTLLQQIEIRPGGLFKPERISQDIQKIYDLGLFSSIDVHVEELDGKVVVTFFLKERPLISGIEFNGNKKIKDDEFEEALTISSVTISDPLKLKFYPQTIKEDIDHIKQLYREKGYHNAQVTSQLLPDPSYPEDNVILQYEIEERAKVTVRKVSFIGNTAFSSQELRKQMATRKKGFFAFITGSGKYEETTFETDLERLKFFYVDNGYIDVNVTDYSLDFKEEKSDLLITITLDEGALYTIKDIAIIGNTVYSSDDVHKVVKVAPETPFSRTAIRRDIVAISNLYAKKGYLSPISEKTGGKLLIDPQFTIDRNANKVSLTYAIREGVPHFLNRIVIAGNQNTRDKVIRRELSLHEDELFNKSKLERDRQRVFNLGFFDDVEFALLDGSEDDTVDLNIDVTERSVGSFNFGGGYSSLDNFFITGGITYPNVFGLAHKIDFSASFSGTSQTFNLKYTVPRFLDSPYLVGLDAYKTKREYTSYDSKSIGGGLRLGRKITDRIFGTVRYEYKEVDIADVEEDASTIIKEAEGESITSSASLSLRYSNINNVLLPTKGMQTKLTGKVAGGILQGENDFYKLILDNNIYFPLYQDVAFRIKGEFAYAKEYADSEDLPIFERFFGGGADTIRGYEERSIGPKDENDEVIGGNTRIVFTTELIIPIRKEIRLVTFFDMGDVYASENDIDVTSFKKSVGIGARFYTPLGLLRFDWGYKLEKESGESDSEFHFGIGAPL